MKTLVLVALVILVTSSVAMAEVSGEIALKNNYIGCDSGATFYPGRVVQGCIDVSLPANAYAGVWGSLPIDDVGENNGGKELDLYVGKEFSANKLSFDLGVCWYNIAPIRRISGDFVAVYTNLGYDCKVAGFKPALHVEHDFTTDGSPTGTLVHLSFARQIGKVDLSLHLGGHPNSFGIPAEWPSFAAIQAVTQTGSNTFIGLRLQKATGISDGLTENTATLSWTYKS